MTAIDPTADPTSNQNIDPRTILTLALDRLTPLVGSVDADPDLATRTTPCPDWTVADLLRHLLAVQVRVPHILRGGQPFDLPSLADGAEPGGWGAAWDAARVDLDAAVEEPDLLDRTVTHPAGTMPAAGALWAYASEVAAHGWDLASALGRTDGLDQELAAACLGPTLSFLPEAGRESDLMPFEAVVAVPDDATPYNRLVGWYGRDPHWHA